jgi:hypothetical protein
VIQVIPELVEVQGRTKVKLTIREAAAGPGAADGPVLDADLVDPFNAAQRRKVAGRLAERVAEPGVAEQIERAILQCVELLGGKDGKEDDADGADAGGEVVGQMTVVRPELVVTREVVAVSVPEVVVRDDEAVGRWKLYLRLAPEADGQAERRQARPLSARLDPGGGREALWVHPVPSAPSPGTTAGWSAESRKAWLDGSAVAEPCAVFDELCAALAEYLDVGEGENAKMEDGGSTMAADHGNAAASRDPDPSSIIHPPSSYSAPHPLIATLAFWTLLTYAYVAWDAVPYLFVNGPAGSGKTRVFELLSRLAFRPLASSNLSAAALFRTLHDRGGTLLLDEAERLAESGEDVAELRSILLAGYKRGGRASRLESAGESYRMSEFCVFGPKAIACINALPAALASRCIPVQMFRSPPGSDKPRRRVDVDPTRWQRLRDQLHLLALGDLGTTAPDLANLAAVCPLGGRQYELWQPVLALASWVDFCRPNGTPPSLHPRVLAYAKGLCDAGSESLLPEEDYLLLRTLTVKAVDGQEPNCKTILETARHADADAVRGVSARRVAEILKRYGLQTERNNGRHVFRDVLCHLKTVETRYAVDLNTSGKDNVNVVRVTYY